MLRLEKLELVGFKSFADKLEVEFNDRVTAVVGPNGCGKSNLFDALGWVLGSQSPRFLRGDKMEDVIFSGSKKRKVSGVAEVSLTLCRPGGQTVSIDGTESEGETVEIRRKLYRSGESHYLINQRRCRLKDIQKVMEDLGLGYATYALIPQGRIDSFLTGRPSDRRAVIEEAARILSYKSRRRSAELKLEMAQQNLSRVNDIISEVERSLRSLKRQAAKARRYREVKAEFRRVQLQRFKLESQSLEQKLSRCESQLEELRQRQATLDESLTEAQRLYRSTSQQRDRLEEELNQLQKDRSEMALETDRVQGSIRHHREQIDSISRYLETSKAEQQVISKSLEKVESELQAFKLEEQEIQAEHGRVSEQESQHGRKVDEHSRELARLEGRIEELTEGQIQLSARKASLENLEAQLQNRLEEFLEQQEQQEVELQEGRLRIEDAEERLAQRREQFRQEQEAIEELRQRLEETQQQSRDLQSQLHQSQQDRK